MALLDLHYYKYWTPTHQRQYGIYRIEDGQFSNIFFGDPYIYPDISTLGGKLLTNDVQEIFLQTENS